MGRSTLLILMNIFLFAGCAINRNACGIKNDAYVDIDEEKGAGSDCTITYSDSRSAKIKFPKECKNAVIINSGSGNLLVSSAALLEQATIINSGSNNANFGGLIAKRIILNDRGSGNLIINSEYEVTGTSRGSGTIILSGSGKMNITNLGSGSIIYPEK